ncbi:Small ubiquitin-related modifier 2 [Bienertia sinuspersici]
MERRSSSPQNRAQSPNPVSSVTGEKGNSSNNNNNADTKTVKITVQKEHTNDVTFLVKRNAALGKLMFKYCLQLGLNEKALKFTYLGKQVKDYETPLGLEMEDEDVIDCFADQTGGYGCSRECDGY